MHRASRPIADLIRARALVALAFCLLALGGCSLLPEVKDEMADWSAERIYKSAHDALIEGNYTRAAKLFETLEARYPYGRYAQQAILEGAYANYRSGETALATSALERFIRTYPNSPNVDYAYYLKGLVYFREDQGLIGYVYEMDLSERDPKSMKESFAAFKELIEKFPKSRYADDARQRMVYLTNAMGMFEVHVARYYYNRGAYLAAANRAQTTLVSYPRTPSNEHALDVLMRSYTKLNMPQLAQDSKAILEKTFPGSPYLSLQEPTPPWYNPFGRPVYKGVDLGTDSSGKPWWQWW